jgi:hypothetical protein
MRLKENTLKWLLAAVILVLVTVVYRLVSAPTASFWDCGELIACSYILGIPHPPGTPLFVLLGRLFSFLPTAREPAARIGFLTSFFGAVTCVLVYLVVVKLVTAFRAPRRDAEDAVSDGKGGAASYSYLPYIAGVVGALALAFAYSFWGNSVETEVYGPVTSVAMLVLLLALNWREKVEKGIGDNRVVLTSIFLVLLSAGIHFTPMLVVFSLLVFWLVVERRAVLDLRFIEFFGGFLTILTWDSMAQAGVNAAVMVVVAAVMLGLLGLSVWVMESSRKTMSIVYGLLALAGMFIVAYVAGFDARTGRDLIVDDVVLFLASPVTAVLERWVANKVLFIVFIVGFAGYLYWLKQKKRLAAGYVALGLGLILLAGTVQYVMMVRAHLKPGINEADPRSWDTFVSVLKREQYDPMKLYPRKTMFATENDYMTNQNAKLGLVAGYFEQVKFYLRYFFWQWAGKENLDILAYGRNWAWPFLKLNPLPGLVGLLIPLLGLWGMVDRWRKDKKGFALIGLAFLVASLGLLTYLNLKLSPTDPRHLYTNAGRGEGMHYVEVRERDYFFAFSYLFYAVFIGLGAYALLTALRRAFRNVGVTQLASGVMVAVMFLPLVFNLRDVNRSGDWIPSEYGYDMVGSCDDGGVLFTNGDNDTFPLWFVQQVPTRVANYVSGFKKPVKPGKGVMVANLSLLSTNWFIRQLIEWGAPFSFNVAKFDSLPQERFQGAGGRTLLLRDLAIREMLATNSGIQLRWGNEYYRLPDPRTGQTVSVPVFRDEYQPARDEFARLMKPVFDSPGPRPAQDFYNAADRYGKWLSDHRYSIAALELQSRMPRYAAWFQTGAALDTLTKERKALETWLKRGDYGMTSAEFVKYVLANYQQGQSPIYFATTVQEEYMRDVIKGDSIYVTIEGLVQRVVPYTSPLAVRDRRIEPLKTRRLIESVYTTASMSDRRVEKDQNSRGMFGNFILADLKLAEQFYLESLQFDRAQSVIDRGLALDVDAGHRIPLFEAKSRYAYLAGDYDKAMSMVDSLQRHIDDPPTLNHLLLMRAFISQLKGDFNASASYTAQVTSAQIPAQTVATVFDTMYANYTRLLGFSYPRDVMARWRRQSPLDSMPVWIGRSLDEIERLRQARRGPGLSLKR